MSPALLFRYGLPAVLFAGCLAQPLLGWVKPTELPSAAPAQDQAQDQAGAAQLIPQSAVIFRGTVLAVEPVPAPPDGTPTMRIRFRVDEAFRGSQTGQLFTLTEWQGLWTTEERYRVGEQLLLFLFAPSPASGLASPVRDNSGRLPLAPTASPPPPAGDPDSPVLDGSPPSSPEMPPPARKPRPSPPPNRKVVWE